MHPAGRSCVADPGDKTCGGLCLRGKGQGAAFLTARSVAEGDGHAAGMPGHSVIARLNGLIAVVRGFAGPQVYHQRMDPLIHAYRAGQKNAALMYDNGVGAIRGRKAVVAVPVIPKQAEHIGQEQQYRLTDVSFACRPDAARSARMPAHRAIKSTQANAAREYIGMPSFFKRHPIAIQAIALSNKWGADFYVFRICWFPGCCGAAARGPPTTPGRPYRRPRRPRSG